MINTIIFDIGNVLIPWEPKWLFRHFFASDEAINQFLHTAEFHHWNLQQDAGRSFADGVAAQRLRFPEYAHLFEAYATRWPETLGPAIETSVELIHHFKHAGFRVLALTNMSHEAFPKVRQNYPFLNEFEGVLVSGEEKLVKPQQEIYARFCQRFKVTPAQAVFIDDSPKNVEAAQQFGLQAIQFTDGGKLRQDLRQLGLPV